MNLKSKIYIEILCDKPGAKWERDWPTVWSAIEYLPELSKDNELIVGPNCCPSLLGFATSLRFSADAKAPHDRSNFVPVFYALNNNDAETETIESGDNEEIPATHQWMLPSGAFHDLWGSLLYDNNLKENLLSYAVTAMNFSQFKVNPHIIPCNRLMFLHGPPGTGKTSLCKAIAQKLSIRMNNTYPYTHFIEINSHSLFSRWFSESGKLVMKLFGNIKTLAADKKSLVCVLIDEVESITYSRSSTSDNEPKDALRVVNAVLTQIDQIRSFPNIFIFTTSNITSSIDEAFIDRAGYKQFIGFPNPIAIHSIFMLAIKELIRVEILKIENSSQSLTDFEDNELWQIVKLCEGFSGRTLKNFPFSAYVLMDQHDHSVKHFLFKLTAVVEQEMESKTKIISKADTL